MCGKRTELSTCSLPSTFALILPDTCSSFISAADKQTEILDTVLLRTIPGRHLIASTKEGKYYYWELNLQPSPERCMITEEQSQIKPWTTLRLFLMETAIKASSSLENAEYLFSVILYVQKQAKRRYRIYSHSSLTEAEIGQQSKTLWLSTPSYCFWFWCLLKALLSTMCFFKHKSCPAVTLYKTRLLLLDRTRIFVLFVVTVVFNH